ncbi:amino acid ABC transporter permease [Minwuia thermotolerans]|uniref:Amino acid ABC transporter permease n=1 Tax=Minwuia thermotolerans TaxID=2056226 RepID=A0A2M9G1K9_9PROT|nr:amino acid ABC transporter permease [Minwuia thermotolerans]PJK29589.1 amino acid ABC transporter permease [Minwuia thermotolerans]
MVQEHTARFVADKQIPAAPPPRSESGAIAWLRTNLFSGVFNTILTLLGLYVIYLVMAGITPWLFLDSVWNASSLSNCREIDDGACLAVINERWLQFFFGFYPDHLRWRPSLTFALLFVSLYPVLFSSAPRKLLILSAAYPLIAYWLIWGGSIWGPVLVAAALGIGFLIVQYGSRALANVMDEGVAFLTSVGLAIIAAVLWWLFLVVPLDDLLTSIVNIGLEPVESARIGGFLLSLILGFTGIAGSLPIGICLALGRQSNLLIIKAFCTGFIEFIRGVPLITLLFVASVLLSYFLPPDTEFDLILRVIIMVTAFASAYMAEVIRGGLAALPRGQYEAADALGLDYWKSMRLIILPQALKISIPGIVNTFIGLFKDTTLVSIIGLLDPVGILNPIRADQNWNGIVWELYGFVALFYFIFCFSMSRYSMYLERKLETGHR